MREIKTLMENSYRGHPAFSFGVQSWNLPKERLIVFNETYLVARQLASTLSTSGRAAQWQELLKALDDVFTTFEKQSADEYEARFLLELRSASLRLLQDELQWYSKPPQTRFLDLTDERVRQSTARMLRDRHYFGNLPKAVVEELRNLAERELAQCRVNAAAGRLKREDLSVNSGPTVRKIRGVLNKEFKALGVLDVVSALAGTGIP